MGYPKSLVQLIESEIGEPKVGCEVGVWEGKTSAVLLRSFPRLTLLMVDWYVPYAKDDPDRRMRCKTQTDMTAAMVKAVADTSFASDRRVVAVGDSSVTALFLRERLLDVFFMDGDHSQKRVSQDLEDYFPLLRDGGLASGHDYGGRGDKSGAFGVKKAVDKFAGKWGYKIEVIPRHRIWWFVK